jgi:hypothetical protein
MIKYRALGRIIVTDSYNNRPARELIETVRPNYTYIVHRQKVFVDGHNQVAVISFYWLIMFVFHQALWPHVHKRRVVRISPDRCRRVYVTDHPYKQQQIYTDTYNTCSHHKQKLTCVGPRLGCLAARMLNLTCTFTVRALVQIHCKTRKLSP